MVQPALENKKINLQSGFVALLMVLIAGSIGISIAVSVVLSGLGTSKNSFALNRSDQAKGLADGCAERGLEAIRDNNNYTGTTNLALGQGNCSYTVSGTNPNKTINATGTVGTAGTTGYTVRKVKVIINQIKPKINVSSWQEVADF
jgi:hypothetical protein